MDGDRLRIAGVDAGRGLNDPQSAVAEAEDGHRGVFHFDPLMGQGRREAADAFHRPHQPQQQVHIVNGLVHESAAAIPAAGAFPAPFVVVLLRTPPFAGGLRQSQAAKFPLLHRLLERPIGIPETGREDGAQLHPRLVASIDDLLAAFRSDFQRLFYYHVLAGLSGTHRRFQMGAAGRGDDDRIDRLPRDGFLQLAVNRAGGNPRLGDQPLRIATLAAHQSTDAGLRNLLQRTGMKASNHSTADNAKVHHLGHGLPPHKLITVPV